MSSTEPFPNSPSYTPQAPTAPIPSPGYTPTPYPGSEYAPPDPGPAYLGSTYSEQADGLGSASTDYTSPADGADTNSSTTQAAKDEAGKVAGQAGQSAQKVAGVAKEQVADVANEAKSQVKELWSQTRSELTDQAGAQQYKAAAGLRSLGDQLQSMAERAEEPGVATDLAGQAADRVHEFAGFLENRDPAGLLDEVRSFARRRPGAFLALALGAGMVTGRLARGLAADPEETQRSTATASRVDEQWQAPALTSDRPALGTTVGYPATTAEPTWEGRP